MGDSASPLDDAGRDALVAAMAHPVRSQVLFALAERPEVTIRQIAIRIDEPGRRVRHHLEALKRDGLVTVERRSNRRGGVEYLYSAALSPTLVEFGDAVTEDQQRAIALQVLRSVLADATAAVRAGTFGNHPGHGEVRCWGEVDGEGWDRLAAIHLRAYGEVEEAIAAAGERVRRSGEPGRPVTSAMLLFESSNWQSDS
jgi:DNA-binding transcriptional ArsR family regulator